MRRNDVRPAGSTPAEDAKVGDARPSLRVRGRERDVSKRVLTGVRQALYKYGLHRERDVRIVSAGVPDYQRAIEDAQFCLHTEGNSWGTRIVDYMAFGCVPVIVNDRMLFAFADVLPYDNFSLHFSKRDIPALVARLRSRQDAEALRRGVHDYKRAFVWWSDVGLAYEYTIAALGYKLDQRS